MARAKTTQKTTPTKPRPTPKKKPSVAAAKQKVYAAVRHGTPAKVDAAHKELRKAERRADAKALWPDVAKVIDKGDAKKLAALLAGGVPPDVMASWGEFALMRAVTSGNVELVRVLLDAGATIDKTDFEGETALGGAAWRGHVTIVDVLLERGARRDIRNHFGDAPTDRAKKAGHTALAKRLH